MSQSTPIRPAAHKKQFSLKQICLVTLAIAIIMAIDMPTFARVCLALYAAVMVLFSDWDHDLLDRAAHSIQSGNLKKSGTQIERYIDRSPEDYLGYSWRGYLSLLQSKNPSALADFEKAIRINPKDGGSWLWKGVIQMGEGNYSHSIDSFTIAQILLPDDPMPWLHLGLAKLQSGQVDLAEQDALALIEAYPNEAEIDPFYKSVVFVQGGYEEVIEFCDLRLDSMQTDGAGFQVYRQLSEFKLGNYAKSFAEVSEYCSALPEVWEANAVYAWMLATCPDATFRDAEQAILHGRRAVDALDAWQYQSYLAAAYAENAQFDLAIEFGEKSLEGCWPLYRDALQSRLELYRRGKPYRDTGQSVWSASS